MPTSIGPEPGLIRIGDARLYYDERGEGQPLLLIHAGIADSRMWDQQIDALAERYRVVRYDLRGFGRTACGSGHFRDWEDAAAICAALEIDSAVVIGASMGTRVAMELALERPDLVRGLVLAAPGLLPSAARSDALVAGWKAMEDALDRGEIIRALDIELGLWVDGPRRGSSQVPADVRDRVREMNARAYELEAETSGREELCPAAATRLGEINVPTLLVVGAEDQTDILQAARVLSDEIDGSRTVVFEDAAHMLNMERPDDFNKLVLDFLSGLRGEDAAIGA